MEIAEKISRFSSEKFSGVQEISPRYPSSKSTGSKYFRTQRGTQCPLPSAVFLSYRGLLAPTYWQTSEKKNLVDCVESLLSESSGNVDWTEVCQLTKFVKKKSARECLMQYRNASDPAINHSEWTEDEKIKLQEAVRSFQEHDWCAIADAVGNGRTPLSLLACLSVCLSSGAPQQEGNQYNRMDRRRR
jgi:hypothetical protein